MFIEASAPTRIDLAGGTLDIWPLYLFHEGAQTLNAAISLRAHCSVRPYGRSRDRRVRIVSADTGVTVEASHWSELRDSTELRLLGRLLLRRRSLAAGLPLLGPPEELRERALTHAGALSRH